EIKKVAQSEAHLQFDFNIWLFSKNRNQQVQSHNIDQVKNGKACGKYSPRPVVNSACIFKGERFLSVRLTAFQLVITYICIFQQCQKNHKETCKEINVDRFEVRNLRKIGIGIGDQCGHGEYRGDA